MQRSSPPAGPPGARSGFSFELVDADDYAELRPSYPPAATGWAAGRAGLGPGSLVVDLAAGTGQLCRRLAPTAARLIAVEPARNMRAAIRQRLPGVAVLAGAAEAMPLRAGCVDAIVVGNAFHHFDPVRAFAEARRVLRPGGALGLFWAWSDAEVSRRYPPIGEIERLVESAVRAASAASSIARAYRSWTTPPARVPGFTTLDRMEFPMTHVVPADRLVSLYATSSDVRSLPAGARTDVLGRIQALSRSLPPELDLGGRTAVDLLFREPAGLGEQRRAAP